MPHLYLIFILIIGYLIGAIPTAAWIARFYGIDILQKGSGNSGATNIGRILGISSFLIVFFIDAGKAFIYIWLLKLTGFKNIYQLYGAISLLYGNGFSCFLQGRGGKGIATTAGILTIILPQVMLVLLTIWSLIFLITRTVGIASVGSAFVLPFIIAFYNYQVEFLIFGFLVALWCLWRHSSNIKHFFGFDIA